MTAFPRPEIDSILHFVEESLALNPGYADLYNQAGLIHAFKGRLREARKRFQQTLLISPFYFEARINMAFVHIQQKQWGRAEVALNRCIAADPEDSLSNHTLGVVLLIQGRKEEAIGYLKRAAQLSPFYRSKYQSIGIFDGSTVTLSAAGERRLKKSRLNQHLTNLHYFIGRCYAQLGAVKKAIQEFRTASKIGPADGRYHFEMGKLYDLQGQFESAIQEFQKVRELCPECGMAYAYMSYSYAGMRDLEQALESLKNAVDLHPRYADLRYELGLLYEDREMYTEAIRELTAAVEINPKFLFARINLGVIYEKMGQLDRALIEYERVAELVTEDNTIIDRIDQVKKQMEMPLLNLPNRLEHSDK